jgi:hypothetical protein
MHISQLKNSNFLTKEDVGRGALLTIKEVTQENVAKTGAPEELKYCLHFVEAEKPMVLNSTNGQLIAKITGSEDSDNWGGKKVVLYNDPNVSFGGKVVGGIRVRAPKEQSATPPASPMPVSTEPTFRTKPGSQPVSSLPSAPQEDDVPF